MIHKGFGKAIGPGLSFLLMVALTAGAWLFLEAFRGDSVFWPGGYRQAQVIALIVIAMSFYWMRKWVNSDSTKPQIAPED